jgi:hypothetical protein
MFYGCPTGNLVKTLRHAMGKVQRIPRAYQVGNGYTLGGKRSLAQATDMVCRGIGIIPSPAPYTSSALSILYSQGRDPIGIATLDFLGSEVKCKHFGLGIPLDLASTGSNQRCLPSSWTLSTPWREGRMTLCMGGSEGQQGGNKLSLGCTRRVLHALRVPKQCDH